MHICFLRKTHSKHSICIKPLAITCKEIFQIKVFYYFDEIIFN
jgi:hypothetical protein